MLTSRNQKNDCARGRNCATERHHNVRRFLGRGIRNYPILDDVKNARVIWLSLQDRFKIAEEDFIEKFPYY
jgi:hypothetical protein